MNREDIIRMAWKAGLVNWEATAYANELERFAALVASEKDKKIEELENLILELQERME